MTVTIDDTRLDADVERGATGGPVWNTTVVALSSGYEKRNQNWSSPKHEYDISYGIQSLDNLAAVIAFFYARQGKARGFRFKDWSDYQIGGDTESTPQQIGTGTGSLAIFQITKLYSDAVNSYTRTINKIVSGTLNVYVDGVLQTITTAYTVDLTTGIITFQAGHIPANTKVVAVTCEFDVPVRFDIDKLPINMQLFNVAQISSIPLVELKL